MNEAETRFVDAVVANIGAARLGTIEVARVLINLATAHAAQQGDLALGDLVGLFMRALNNARIALAAKAPVMDPNMYGEELRMRLNLACHELRGKLPDEQIARVAVEHGATIAQSIGQREEVAIQWIVTQWDRCRRAAKGN